MQQFLPALPGRGEADGEEEDQEQRRRGRQREEEGADLGAVTLKKATGETYVAVSRCKWTFDLDLDVCKPLSTRRRVGPWASPTS